MSLPETATRVTDHPCPRCTLTVNVLAVRAADGAALWFRCQSCGCGWNADEPQQASLFEAMEAR